MEDLDYPTSSKRNGVGDHSVSSLRKKPRNVAKTASIYLKHFDLPLISTATGCVCDLICLSQGRPCNVGRSNRVCQFVFDDRRVSKHHCQIIFDSVLRKIYIRDGVSLNGVYLNGVRVGNAVGTELSAGDEVLLVCGNEIDCSSRMQIGFVVRSIIFREEIVVTGSNELMLERSRLGGMVTSSGLSQGRQSSGKVSKRVFALQARDMLLESVVSGSKCDQSIERRANSLISQCRKIMESDDPVYFIRQSFISDCDVEDRYACSTNFGGLVLGSTVKFSVGRESKAKSVMPLFEQENLPCENWHRDHNPENKRVKMVQSSSVLFHTEEVVAVRSNHIQSHKINPIDDLCEKDKVGFAHESGVDNDNHRTSPLKCLCKVYGPGGGLGNESGCKFSSPPGKKFYLNRLEFMDHNAQDVISLPELLYPVESISRIFIATFTSDILWFLSYCEIPCHLPVTIACHNTERCWSTHPDKRSSTPYSDFPNLVVVYPPFPEVIAFSGKKQGIGCHHPKLLVLQREDSIRVIITSANLVDKQWNSVTNTVWWQDFPRALAPDYSCLFTQASYGDIDQNSGSDFVAQLAGFMASLVVDVPSQAHWMSELTKYDFGGAAAYLIASVPGIHSYRSPQVSKSMHMLLANECTSWSSGVKLLGSVEASVVGISHLFHSKADSNGKQLKKLATFLGSCHQNLYGRMEVILKRNRNIPADANAVSVLVPNPDDFPQGDCVQLGFLPRNVAKWFSPLCDSGLISFSGYISSKEALAAALGECDKKVPLTLQLSQGPSFRDLSKMMQPEHITALCSLIASIQRCVGLWRLEEVVARYKWPEFQETDFVYGSSSIGAVNAQFLAAFSAASGKRSFQFSDSEESDPEWGCWSASQESKSPSIRIIFPTIERVRKACNGILPSRRVYCFSEKTWQRLRNVSILHDAIPRSHHRVGHPMHVKVALRRFQSRTDKYASGWVYCGSHNFSEAAWGRTISSPHGLRSNGSSKSSSASNSKLHICNFELGIIFVFPPTDTKGGRSNSSTAKLDDIVLPFVVPSPKYGPRDRPATQLAMREALSQLYEQEREILAEAEITEEIVEDITDEEEEVVEATDYVAKEKDEENAYAEILWSQVDSASSQEKLLD